MAQATVSLPKSATFIERSDSFALVNPRDPEAFPIFESDDADDVLAFAWAHGITVRTLND